MKKFALVAAALATMSMASAATITVESGGLSITNFDDSGSGEESDPWIIEETVSDTGTLRWAGGLGGSVSGISQNEGKFLAITKMNDSDAAWTSFEFELQVILGIPSGEGDGISFAQGNGLVFTSDAFSTVTRIDDSRDYLNFSGGSVGIGESVTFFLAISDNSGNDPFYLLQTPNKRDTPDVPEPSTWAMLVGGLGTLAYRLRRR